MKLIDLRFVNDSGGAAIVDRFVLVDAPDCDFEKFCAELEDSVASYMEAEFRPGDDTPYAKAVNAIMDACGRRWMPIDADDVKVMRI